MSDASNSAIEMRPGLSRPAVVDLLYRLADDDLMIGHRNSEWTGLGPILEADIAFSSMAQDEMGHAAAYYRLLHELGEPEPDALAFARGPEQYRCCSLAALGKGDWAFSLLRQYLYDSAEHERLLSLRESTFEPLGGLARKFLAEEKYHLMHGRSWLARLSTATDESRRRMQAALDEAWPHALGMFEPTPHDESLAAAGVIAGEAELGQRWRRGVEAELRAAGLPPPDGAAPVYGGRVGRHPASLGELLDAMQRVYRLDPAAAW